VLKFGLAMILAGLAHSDAAGAAIPYAAMTATNAALVRSVAERATLMREYPSRTIRGRHEQFEFLLDNMVACSVLSQSLGLIYYRAVEDDAGRALANDREGGEGSIQQVYCGEGLRIYHVEGVQRGVFEARGRGVAVVQFAQTSPGTIEYTGRMFVKVENPVVATLAQVFFVFVKNIVDRHFEHVMRQPINLTSLAFDDPAMLRQCIGAMSAKDHQRLTPFAESLPAGTNTVAR
jgi:hypothetical protein